MSKSLGEEKWEVIDSNLYNQARIPTRDAFIVNAENYLELQ